VAINVRNGTIDDATALLRLWRDADAVPSVSDSVEGIAALTERDPGALLVAESSGRVVGSIIAGWDGWRGGIYRLAGAPDRRRAGIATALLRAAEERLLSLGARRIAAIVMHEHEQAVGFWEAAGYERDTRVVRYIKSVT
jgi:ribosomal protein S18 acetylase RimI-like enzyme